MTLHTPPLLLVDDEPDNLEALVRTLRSDFQVEHTTSPLTALEWIRKKKYHVVLCDQRMPAMTGVELFEKMKEFSQATRVLLTGYTDIESVIAAINRGNIYRYLHKPWDPAELKVALKQANEVYELRATLKIRNEELEGKNQELSDAVRALSVLDRAKARFLSLVSHELNTPLTALRAHIDLLATHVKPADEDLAKIVNGLSRGSERLSLLIQEVLYFVQLESQPGLTPQRQKLLPLLNNALHPHSPKVLSKKLQLHMQSDPQTEVWADTHKLQVALNKIVEEILERSFEKSQLSVSLGTDAHDRSACITLAYHGEETANPKTTFATPENMYRHGENLGLKVALANALIEAHGGTLEVVGPSGMDHTQLVRILLPRNP